MNAEKLRERLIEIAMLETADHHPELCKLKAQCIDGGYPQTMPVLQKQLRQVMAQAENITAQPVVERINESWFIIGGEGATRFARWEESGLAMYKRADFAMLIAPLTGLAQGKKPDEVYLQSAARRAYSGVTIDASAGPVVNGKVNLWQGYGVTPTKGDEGPFLDYLKAVFPNEWQYVLNWSAWVVQNPDKRINVALFLISRTEGTGKSTLGFILRRIFGRHSVKASKSGDLVGQFNGHLASALFVHGDEILFRGNKQGADQLKTIITDDRLRVEPKGVPSFEKDNHISMLLTSNHEHAAHIGPSDRRYAFAEASDALANNTAYWDGFYGWLAGGGTAIVAEYLLDLDLGQFDPREDRPFSELYLINKRGSLQQVARWWRDCIDAEEILGRAMSGAWENDGWVTKKFLFKRYCEWQHEQRGYGDAVEARLFWKNMHEIGAIVAERRPTGNQPREVKLATWAEAEKNMFAQFN